MFLLLPTCNSHASIASISLALLRRYWADHPVVHVLHHEARPTPHCSHRVVLHDCGPQDRSSWVATVRSFLQKQTDEFFILLLDDYALCGPARVDQIEAGARLMRQETSVGMFPLCWYPAARREPRVGHAGMVNLHGAPILLQAAIWRRDWFLELADRMDPRTSPWGFEASATQLAKRMPREICAIEMREPAYPGGHLVDGFDKSDWPLPYHNLMHGGDPEERHARFLYQHGLSFPARGLGDTVAGMARVAGIAQVVEAVHRATGYDCGCQRRRRALNRAVPYITPQK